VYLDPGLDVVHDEPDELDEGDDEGPKGHGAEMVPDQPASHTILFNSFFRNFMLENLPFLSTVSKEKDRRLAMFSSKK
jgi:hypothetical protein